jgi:hypothetical protein
MSYPAIPPQSLGPTPVAGPYPAAPPPGVLVRRMRRPSGRRVAAAALLALAVVLAGISLGSSWWTISTVEDGTTGYIYFLPGSSAGFNEAGNSGTQSYTSGELNNTGMLFQALFYLIVGALAVAAVGCVLAFVCALHRAPKSSWSTGAAATSVAALALALVGVVLVPAVEPSLFAKDNPDNICGAFQGAGSNSPCTTFWGSLTTTHGTVTWGADLGWYLMVIALVFLVAAFVLWFSARKQPLAREVLMVVPAAAPPVASPWSPAPPAYPGTSYSEAPSAFAPTASAAPPMTAAYAPRGSDWWLCPACGTPNSVVDPNCHRCGQPVPPPG